MTTREALEARLEPHWAARPVWKGLDVGEGWIDLIDELWTRLESLPDPLPEIVQIKTKFGGLRFYTNAITPEQRAVIDSYEDRSETVCEECGMPGTPISIRHWIWTLCPVCRAEKEKEAGW